MFFAKGQLDSAESIAKRIYGDLDRGQQSEWGAVETWIQASECATRTGILLVVCPGEKLLPYASASNADDPGHALILGVFGIIKNKVVDYRDVAKIHLRINFLGLALLSTLLMFAGFPLAALALVISCSSFLFDTVSLSPHSSLMGVAMCVALLPVTLYAISKRRLSKALATVYVCLGIALIGFASFVREAIGLMGLIIVVGVAAWLLWRDPRWVSRVMVLLVVCLSVVAWHAPSISLDVRDRLYPVAKAKVIERHGFSHTLYLGLGTVPNKWGIEWSDGYAFKTAQEQNPEIEFLSPEYYDLMTSAYLEKVREDPLEVARIYTVKMIELLTSSYPQAAWPLAISIGLAMALIWFVGRLGRAPGLTALPVTGVIGISAVFIALFVMQGIAAHPSYLYAMPVGCFVCLIYAMILDEYWSAWRASEGIKLPEHER